MERITPRPAPCIEIDHHALRVFGDRVKVDQRAQVLVVSRDRVEAHNLPGIARLLVIHQVRAAALFFIIVQVHFHVAALFGQGRPAVGGLELHPIVARGIVRGRDHDPGGGVEVAHRIRNDRCRSVGVGQIDGVAVGRQHTGYFQGVAVGEEASVETDDHLMRVGRRIQRHAAQPIFGGDRIGDGLGDHAQVMKGEII